MHIRPALRAPLASLVLTAVAGVLLRRDRQHSGKHGLFQPGIAHAPAHLLDGDLVLNHLDLPPVLLKYSANQTVIDVAVVSGQQLVGRGQCGSQGELLFPLKISIAAAGIVAAGELDFLAGQQGRECAGLHIQ